MKAIKTLIVLLLLTSCSINDNLEENCGCTKTTYYYKDISTQYIQYTDTYIISVEDNVCGDPAFKEPTELENIYYKIICQN